jgi:hypothetical protein
MPAPAPQRTGVQIKATGAERSLLCPMATNNERGCMNTTYKFNIGDKFRYGCNDLIVVFRNEKYYACKSLSTSIIHTFWRDQEEDMVLTEAA